MPRLKSNAGRSPEFLEALCASPLHQRFWADPDFADAVLFNEEVRPWKGPREMRESVIVNKWTLVSSANSCGKTHEAAKIAIRWLLSHYPAYVVVTSSSWDTMMQTIMPHILGRSNQIIRDYFAFLRPPTATEWWPAGDGHRWAIVTASPKEPENIAGRHNRHVLAIGDESSALPPEIGTAINGITTRPDDRVLLMANPIVDSGYFYSLFNSSSKRAVKFTFDLMDTPNFVHNRCVIPGMPMPEWAAGVADQFGEDSDVYQARVRGRFPTASSMTLVSAPMIEHATVIPRPVSIQRPIVMGVDVARSIHGDESIIVIRDARQVLLMKGYRGMEQPALEGEIRYHANEYDPDEINIDSGGLNQIGACLRDAGMLNVNDITSSSSAHDARHFHNARAEMFQHLSNALRRKELHIPREYSQSFAAEAGIQRIAGRSGKILVEGKDEIKKRISRSPDHLDALALTYAVLPGERVFADINDNIVMPEDPVIRRYGLGQSHFYTVAPKPLDGIARHARKGIMVRALYLNQFSPSAAIAAHIDEERKIWTVTHCHWGQYTPEQMANRVKEWKDETGVPFSYAIDLISSADTADYPDRLMPLYENEAPGGVFSAPTWFKPSDLATKAGIDTLLRLLNGSNDKQVFQSAPALIVRPSAVVTALKRVRALPPAPSADPEFQPSPEKLYGQGGPVLCALRMIAIELRAA